ncbi:histidine phosphatase family protein [Rufibacter sediminis]|uniref:Histidine phosphatase family protein n=1 Tax=Rufibacter sediminis TaxID=2762756 RepID=A0ABR6VME2_9BACT|nr:MULTISPECIES: histidine phosphatase family protein [Rufibacter]MBC3538347.1 histidine phosphatase family protein [Rufibacter sediminis]
MLKRLFLVPTLVLITLLSVQAEGTKLLHQTIQSIEARLTELSRNASYVTANGKPVAQRISFFNEEDLALPVGSKVRQIALIRHGEPDLRKVGKFSYREANQFAADYDSVGIIVPDTSFFNIQNPNQLKVFSSSINRAKATAQYIFGINRETIISPIFREFESSMGHHSPNIRLPINLWTSAARVKWVLGIDRQGAESFAEARKRAKAAARTLADASEEKTNVALVAHGLLNRYIQENLEKMGWHVVRNGGTGYLGTTILVKL